MSDLEDKYCINRRKPSPSDELLLLDECVCICPLCGNSLISKNNKKKKQFEVAHIYPNSPTPEEKIILAGVERLGDNSEDIKNWISICSKCHTEYDFHKTRNEYEKVLGIKKRMIDKNDVKHLLSGESIESELSTIISNLCSLSSQEFNDIEKLSYEALSISGKITNLLLCNDVSQKVINYYLFIKQQFELQEQNGCNLPLETIAANFKHAYYTCKRKGLGEEHVFSELTNWLIEKVHCEVIAAQIIISFFVQNCDIYEKLSK